MNALSIPPPDALLTPREAAGRLGISIDVLDGLVLNGKLAFVNVGRGKKVIRRRFDSREIECFKQDAVERYKPAPSNPGVYVVGYASYVKIGFTEDFKTRRAGLQVGIPETLVFYAFLHGSLEREKQLHQRFSNYRLRGEWFRKEGELAAWIDRGCCR